MTMTTTTTTMMTTTMMLTMLWWYAEKGMGCYGGYGHDLAFTAFAVASLHHDGRSYNPGTVSYQGHCQQCICIYIYTYMFVGFPV